MNFIKLSLAFLLMLASQLNSYSQSNVVLCLGQDATICAGQTVTINNCNTGTTLEQQQDFT